MSSSAPAILPPMAVRQEVAREALAGFFRMKPQMAAMARALTGKPITVEPTGGTPRTDGKTIWMRVLPEMADRTPHNRTICDSRDAFGDKVCKACRTYENMSVTLYHEIAHLMYDSFEKPTEYELLKVVKDAVDEAAKWGLSGSETEAIRKRFKEAPPTSYPEAASLVSPFMPMLLNAVEDARVNARLFGANPGLVTQFSNNMRHIFEDGIEGTDGSVVHWRDQKPNAQAMIGVLLQASGVPHLIGYLSEPIQEMMKDTDLIDLCRVVTTTDSVADSYAVSLPILERMRDLGYCGPRKRPEPEPEPAPEPDAGEDADPSEVPSDEPTDGDAGEPTDDEVEDDADDETLDGDDEDDDATTSDGGGEAPGLDDDSDDDGHSDLEDEDADDGQDDPDGEDEDEVDGASLTAETEGDDSSDSFDNDGDGSSGDFGDGGGGPSVPEDDDEYDPSLDENGTPDEVGEMVVLFGGHENDDEELPVDDDVESAIKQNEYFDAPSSNVMNIQVSRVGRDDTKLTRHITSGLTHGFTPVDSGDLQKNLAPLRVAFSENRKDVHTRNLRSGRVNSRVLGRRVPTDDDRIFKKKRTPGKRDYHVVIGLDISASTRGGAIKVIKSAAYAQAELLSRLGVSFEIWAHSSSMNEVDEDEYQTTMQMFSLKDAHDPWGPTQKGNLMQLRELGGNLDGHTMEFYRKCADKSRATDKVIIYYTDGEMPAENFVEEKAILERECITMRQRGYAVLGVGVGTDSPSRYGLDTVKIYGVQDVHLVVSALRKKIAAA